MLEKLKSKKLRVFVIFALIISLSLFAFFDRKATSNIEEKLIFYDIETSGASSDQKIVEKSQVESENVEISTDTGIVVDKSNKININTASSEELQSLYRIGPSTAQKIIDYRETFGEFVSIEEIKEVSGIGDAIFNKIKDQITVK